MAAYDAELLTAARMLLVRRAGQRGRLASARIRRSISTAYYALFHFVLEEVGIRLVGATNALRVRRRILARTISHRGVKTTFDKLRGVNVGPSVADFVRVTGIAGLNPPLPDFARNLARVFIDAQAKRHDADYDLNTPLSENDASVLISRVERVIRDWRNATSRSDRDLKSAICTLILLKGQLRSDS